MGPLAASRAGRRAAAAAALLLLALAATVPAGTGPVLRVGSKAFTESYILAEMVAQLAERAGEARVERRLGLGGTGILYGALASGAVDVYPEYTGTIGRAILRDPSLATTGALRARLRPLGLTLTEPLGFENSYALAVRRQTATRLGLAAISDLARHPGLRAAFDPGFLEREDGWLGLRRHYGLAVEVRVMEHALTYPAVTSGRADVIDVFTTDGQLARLDLVLLEDDRRFFPAYAAVLLARASVPERFPRTWAALQERLVGRIDTATMARLNARADLDGRPFAEVAAGHLGVAGEGGGRRVPARRLLALTLEHLFLVGVALGAAVVVGVPLGLLAARHRLLGQLELIGVGVLQTIPALALLAFMIPLLGIGTGPALVALSLYALLPIVRNTYAGITSIEPQLVDMAEVMRLRGWRRLAWIELPLASVTIMAGVKTAAVLTVGTATLAAFVGGGGYGTLIITGLALNDVTTILAGAVPAAVMALVVHAAFEGLDRLLVPPPLRR